MSDIAHQASTARQTLLALAKQANALAVGLQNAAPSDKSNQANPSIEYLVSVVAMLNKMADACQALALGDYHD